ncbi:MAG: hypothetical protein MRJ92_13950 [Nitrospira sp.]|nr:hypothetical protein [Nitrospira sp.]
MRGLMGEARRERGRWSPLVAGLVLLLGIAAVTAAQEDDKHTIEPAQARRAVTLIHARCAVCHTTDLIVQQRLPPDRWQVTVEKMMHWGADLSKDEAATLLQFVTARYHPGAPDHLPSIEEELAMTAPAGGPSPRATVRWSGCRHEARKSLHGTVKRAMARAGWEARGPNWPAIKS